PAEPPPRRRSTAGQGRADQRLLGANAPQISPPLDEQSAARDGGRRKRNAFAEVVSGQDLELGSGREDVTPPRTGEVDAPVGGGDGTGARRNPGQPFLVDLFTAGDFPAAEQVVVAGAIEILPDHDARTARRRGDLNLPLHIRFADIASAGEFD